MRRRPKQAAAGAPPLELRRYDAADWPDPECHPECAFWAAREAWHAKHPTEADALDIIADGPDAPWHPEWI